MILLEQQLEIDLIAAAGYASERATNTVHAVTAQAQRHERADGESNDRADAQANAQDGTHATMRRKFLVAHLLHPYQGNRSRPELLKAVEPALLGAEDMDDHVAVVHQHPA